MKYFLTILFLCMLCFSFSYKPDEDALSISGLKTEYKSGESIRFQMTNTTENDLYVSYGLWQWIKEEKEWFAIVPDLLNTDCDRMKKLGITYNIFKAKQSKTVIWNPKKAKQKICFNWKHRQPGIYRIEIRFTKDKDAETQTICSKAFTIN